MKFAAAITESADDELKDVVGEPEYRSFNLEFVFGDRFHTYSTIVNVPAYILAPAGNNLEVLHSLVRDYAYNHLSDDPANQLQVGFISRCDWDWLVNVEETDPAIVAESGSEPSSEDSEDFKEVYGQPQKYGYYVYFSRPVMFGTPEGPKKLTKIGPYLNTYEAARKKRFGLRGEVDVTAVIKREPIDPEELEYYQLEAKDVAGPSLLIIRNKSNPRLYWSRNEGWTDYTSADTFLPTLAAQTGIPEDGEIVPIEESIAFPPQLYKPAGLSEEGKRAWRVIVDLLIKDNAFQTGHHQRIFESKDGHELVVLHDSGDHAPYFNTGYNACLLYGGMTAALRKAGYYAEAQNPGCSIIRRLPIDEGELAVLIDALKKVNESDDYDEETKDLLGPDNKIDRIHQLFASMGLHLENTIEAPTSLGQNSGGQFKMAISSVRQPDQALPWTTNPVAGPEVGDFIRRGLSNLGEILETNDVDCTSRFLSDLGAWEFKWFIGWLKESEESDFETKDVNPDQAWEFYGKEPDRWFYWNHESHLLLIILKDDGYNYNFRLSVRGHLYNQTSGQFKSDEEAIKAAMAWAEADATFLRRKNMLESEEWRGWDAVNRTYWIEDGMPQDAIQAIKSVAAKAGRTSKRSGCWDSAFIWATYLQGVLDRSRIKIALGRCIAEHRWLSGKSAETESHVWLEIDGKIFDPTAFQFTGSLTSNAYKRQSYLSENSDFESKPPWYDPAAGAQKIRHDVEGAPAKIGQKVKVTSIVDNEEPSAWANMVGQEGVVDYLEYSCGCGQSYPDDPMIGVRFADGATHEFWKEELQFTPSTVSEGVVAYHASPDQFDEFDMSKEGAHFGTYEQAANVRKPGLREPRAYVLSIKNPLRLHDIGVWNKFNNLHTVLSTGNHITDEQADAIWAAWQKSDAEGWQALKQALEQNGYDSIVYQNEQEGPGDSYLVWHNEQIARPSGIKEGGDNESDLDDMKEVSGVPFFQPGDLVRKPSSHWPEMVGRISHALNREDDPVWWIEWWERPQLNGYAKSTELELVERPSKLSESDETPSKQEITQAAARVEEPTDAQKEAGNYKKGHVVIHGLDISIENSKGSERSGKDKDGKEWKVTLPAHYGYIKGTEGKDKDHLDVFIGPDTESEKVFVVNQNKLEGGFDEHKVMILFKDRSSAIETYDKAYSDGLGPKLRESVVSTTMDKFQEWLKSGDKKKPFSQKADESQGLFDYLISIRPKMDEAREAAAAKELDGDRRQSILSGHGTYIGSCGHRIQGCRCPERFHCGTVKVDAVCESCSRLAESKPLHKSTRPPEIRIIDENKRVLIKAGKIYEVA